MKYINIKAETYQEAMKQLKINYGDDALVVSHKNIKEGGFFKSRIFGKDMVELTACIREHKNTGKSKTKQNLDIMLKDDWSPLLKQQPQDNPDPNSSEILKKINQIKNAHAKSLTTINSVDEPMAKEQVEPHKSGHGAGKDTHLEKELRELRIAVNRLVAGQNSDDKSGESKEKEEAPVIAKYMNILKRNDFDAEESASIIKNVKNSVSSNDLNDTYKIEKSFAELLKSRIVTSGHIELAGGKKIIMFVGPTGVGKTTTMVKLGAIYFKENKKVAFITLDNYRIGATEQLKKYAEIMRFPVYVVRDQNEFKSTIANEKAADVILIDTAGRSQNDRFKIAEMESFADLIEYDFEKILCVSGNVKKSDLNDIFQAFDAINFNSVIITKVDETSNIGNVVDVADKYNKPISYFTNGQDVPNDIVVADSDKIVELMIGNINTWSQGGFCGSSVKSEENGS
ncbi:MAG: flagellar biosynthesis protein FlhF [Leptospirales bacterium]|nr:flagellar biosynthesis protein FlhF [Leptospirales bacterium]